MNLHLAKFFPCTILKANIKPKTRSETILYATIVCKCTATISDLDRHIKTYISCFPRASASIKSATDAMYERVLQSYFKGNRDKTFILYCIHLSNAEEFGSEVCDKSRWACEPCEDNFLCDRETCGTSDAKKKQSLECVGYCCKLHAV